MKKNKRHVLTPTNYITSDKTYRKMLVDGYDFEYKIPLFVHHGINTDGSIRRSWVVTEPETGLIIGASGETRKEAVADVKRAFDRIGDVNIQEIIKGKKEEIRRWNIVKGQS